MNAEALTREKTLDAIRQLKWYCHGRLKKTVNAVSMTNSTKRKPKIDEEERKKNVRESPGHTMHIENVQ